MNEAAFCLKNGLSQSDLDSAYFLHKSGYISHIPIAGCARFTLRGLLQGVPATTYEKETNIDNLKADEFDREVDYRFSSQLVMRKDYVQLTHKSNNTYVSHYFTNNEFVEMIQKSI